MKNPKINDQKIVIFSGSDEDTVCSELHEFADDGQIEIIDVQFNATALRKTKYQEALEGETMSDNLWFSVMLRYRELE